jgi:hypothetical protein
MSEPRIPDHVTGVIPAAKGELTFHVVTEKEWAELDAHWAQEAKDEAKRKAYLDACTHDWHLYTEHPNERDPKYTGPTIEIFCNACHGNVTEVYGRFLDMVCLEFDDVVIQDGRHNLTDQMVTAPIAISTWSGQYVTDYGMEHDWGIDLEVRGPAVYKDIEP